MNLSRLSALSIALVCFAGVRADEVPADALSSPAQSTPVPWSSFDANQSTLLPQARAVFAALRRLADPEGGVEVVSVAAGSDDVGGNEFCRHMGTPSSRIMSRRCFNQTESEKTFDDYQYQEEIKLNRQLYDATIFAQ